MRIRSIPAILLAATFAIAGLCIFPPDQVHSAAVSSWAEPPSAGSAPKAPSSPSLYTPWLNRRPVVEVAPFVPERLDIPSVNIHAPVSPVGILPDGRMGVPDQFDRVGILVPWTRPGEPGAAVISGHLDHYTGPAIFYRLRDLKRGDPIVVSDARGHRLTFTVASVETILLRDLPLGRIFRGADKPGLNLITCAGKFNRRTREHASRLIVFAELVQS